MWQKLRTELHPKGLEIVTIALDTGGADAARPWIEKANARHPALIDRAHIADEFFGMVNVPSGVWINEDGMIVRPPETAYPQRPSFLDREIPADATPSQREGMMEVRKLRIEAEKYVAALRDWAARGSESRFALAPRQVIERSRPRSFEEGTASAHFELGQHLHRAGLTERGIGHFQQASRLQPENWTYRRQAWNLLPPDRKSIDVYGTDWLTEVKKSGAENYYAPLEM